MAGYGFERRVQHSVFPHHCEGTPKTLSQRIITVVQKTEAMLGSPGANLLLAVGIILCAQNSYQHPISAVRCPPTTGRWELKARFFYWFQELAIIPGNTRTLGRIQFVDTIKYVGSLAKVTHKTVLPTLLTGHQVTLYQVIPGIAICISDAS